MQGKIYMKSKNEMCLAPNGFGGVLDGIQRSPEAVQARIETEFVQIIGIDNVMNHVLDPIQIGFT